MSSSAIDILSYTPEVEKGIYETPDSNIPEFRPYRVIEERENENIDRSNIQIANVVSFFKQRVGDDGGEKKKVAKAHHKALYRSYVSDLKSQPDPEKNTVFKELPTKRLDRILFETQELEREINELEPETKAELSQTPLDLLNKINEFQQKVAQLTLKLPGVQSTTTSSEGDVLMKKLNSLFISDKLPAVPNSLKPPPYHEQVSQALELEARVASLEDLLGPETLIKAELPQEQGLPGLLNNMNTMLEKIRRPDHMFSINKRLKEFISELDKLVSNRDSLKLLGKDLVYLNESCEMDSETKAKVDSMLILFHKFELYIALGPQFSSRLRQLTAMHQELAGFGSVLSNITEEMGTIQTITKEGEKVYQELYTQLQSSQNEVDSKLTSIDTRISELLQRIESLH